MRSVTHKFGLSSTYFTGNYGIALALAFAHNFGLGLALAFALAYHEESVVVYGEKVQEIKVIFSTGTLVIFS